MRKGSGRMDGKKLKEAKFHLSAADAAKGGGGGGGRRVHWISR